SLHRSSRPQPGETAAASDGWHTSPEAAFAEAAATGKPLFIDFWGISCKACNTMDATTLKNPEVTRRLDGMVRLKIQADDFNAPGVAEYVLKYGVIGLPTYIVTVVDGE
ncbi:MAG: thioredoxin family protein, partial [Victivallales bacterium]|nr:thioredoxin family protein [Victivallales bacterium]